MALHDLETDLGGTRRGEWLRELAAGAHWHSQCHPQGIPQGAFTRPDIPWVALAAASAGLRAANNGPTVPQSREAIWRPCLLLPLAE